MKAYTADIQNAVTSGVSDISPETVTALFVNDNAFSLESLCEYRSLRHLYIKETCREALDLSDVELPATLQSIVITNNKKLTKLVLALTKGTELESLQIVGNALTNIEIDVEHLPKLKRLVIRNNAISHLEANLAALPIEYIDLSANQLSTLAPELLGSPTLQSIILYDNNLTDSSGIFPDESNHLQSIDLGKNKLTDFAFCPANNSVEALTLSLNQLSNFPRCLEQYHSLKRLHLSGNPGIEDLPDWFSTAMPNLQVLQLTAMPNLSEKTLQHIPSSVETLYLSYGNLTQFPEAITHLSALNNLFLNGNHIRSIPNSIKQLSSLTYIELVDNDLKALPDELLSLPALEEFNVSYNDFSLATQQGIANHCQANNIEYTF